MHESNDYLNGVTHRTVLHPQPANDPCRGKSADDLADLSPMCRTAQHPSLTQQLPAPGLQAPPARPAENFSVWSCKFARSVMLLPAMPLQFDMLRACMQTLQM